MVSVVPLPKLSSSSIAYSLPVRWTPGAVDFHGLGVEVDRQLAGADDRLAVALRAAHHGVDAGDQLVAVERLRHVIVGDEAERADLRSPWRWSARPRSAV